MCVPAEGTIFCIIVSDKQSQMRSHRHHGLWSFFCWQNGQFTLVTVVKIAVCRHGEQNIICNTAAHTSVQILYYMVTQGSHLIMLG